MKPSAASIESALATWFDDRLREGASYREMHDTIEATMLRHLLARFDGRPTILARETKMNRVTLRKKLAQIDGRPEEDDGDDEG